MLSKHNLTGLNYDNKEFKNINGGSKQFENGSDFKKSSTLEYTRRLLMLLQIQCGKHFCTEMFLL